jgi:hypothetical protein
LRRQHSNKKRRWMQICLPAFQKINHLMTSIVVHVSKRTLQFSDKSRHKNSTCTNQLKSAESRSHASNCHVMSCRNFKHRYYICILHRAQFYLMIIIMYVHSLGTWKAWILTFKLFANSRFWKGLLAREKSRLITTIWSGLPDGLFWNQKIPIWVNLECLRFENVDIFYGHWRYYITLYHHIISFGTFCINLVHFVLIWFILC